MRYEQESDMPRYEPMHWSQRARDQQPESASLVHTVPGADVPKAPRKAGPSRRPRPPRDEDAENLVRLCREGRLFELQSLVDEGKSLRLPNHYRYPLLRIALDTGFHSLIEFFLQLEMDQTQKDEVLKQSCWRNQPAVIRLALKYGADIGAIPFQDVIETWDREVVQLFLDRGADIVTNAPFARAFKQRVKAALGSFLDCKRARPDLAGALQEQADMALRQACQDEDLKWVSLLMWLGANPRTKGLSTDDLDDPDIIEDHTYQQSALQIACASRKPEILRRLKPDPAIDNLGELITAAASIITTPETVAYLVSLGADINDKPEGGSTVLDACLRNFGWKESVWEAPYGAYRHTTVPTSRLGKSLEALRFLLSQGARWTPNEAAVSDVRRSLYRVDADAIATVLDLLRTHGACNDDVLKAVIRTPKMRAIMVAAERQRPRARREAEPLVKRKPERPHKTTPSFFHSRYDRERLYGEVWAEPTQQVAKRYGVSDVAIAKACRLLGIPKPPRGYWAKKAAGHKLPTRPPLPDLDK